MCECLSPWLQKVWSKIETMSILLGPFDKADKPSSEDVYNKNEFIVLGYQCRLYRNDDKANMENDEELLIPWMGDRSLMVDRLVGD